MTVAESFKRFRKEFHLTQAQVAAALGVSQQAYQVYENKTVPTVTVLVRIADAFNVSADYLLGLTDDPRPVGEIITAQKTAAPAEVDDEILNAAIALVTALKRKTNSEEGSR